MVEVRFEAPYLGWSSSSDDYIQKVDDAVLPLGFSKRTVSGTLPQKKGQPAEYFLSYEYNTDTKILLSNLMSVCRSLITKA